MHPFSAAVPLWVPGHAPLAQMSVPHALSPAATANAKSTLTAYIKRALLGKAPDEEAALEEAWSRRLMGPWHIAGRLLHRWPAVQQEAAKHSSLMELVNVQRPTGKHLGHLLAVDFTVSERVLVTIVGIPLVRSSERCVSAAHGPSCTTRNSNLR
jgi:hypothetical protein